MTYQLLPVRGTNNGPIPQQPVGDKDNDDGRQLPPEVVIDIGRAPEVDIAVPLNDNEMTSIDNEVVPNDGDALDVPPTPAIAADDNASSDNEPSGNELVHAIKTNMEILGLDIPATQDIAADDKATTVETPDKEVLAALPTNWELVDLNGHVNGAIEGDDKATSDNETIDKDLVPALHTNLEVVGLEGPGPFNLVTEADVKATNDNETTDNPDVYVNNQNLEVPTNKVLGQDDMSALDINSTVEQADADMDGLAYPDILLRTTNIDDNPIHGK